MAKANLIMVLHAHLPFVHHPEHERFFEENWLFEAITECYLPLLGMLDRLVRDGISHRLTLSLSPTLLSMLCNPLLLARYEAHLQELLKLAEKEIVRTRSEPQFHKLARLYRRFYALTLENFTNLYQRDLITAFAQHQERGGLELITTAATHGFLPLLNNNSIAVHNQIKIGIDVFKEHFGFVPQGFWLPECAYYPGLEEVLQRQGVRYFFIESHGVLNAAPSMQSGICAPIRCGNGLLAFGRNSALSQQVWSAVDGYPGDEVYREYYRDIGFDLDADYLGNTLVNSPERNNTGIKYFRISGSETKAVYEPRLAWAKTKQHAADFVLKCRRQIDEAHTKGAPILAVAFDAELFGHWWFEGPLWLETLIRQLAKESKLIQLSWGSAFLDKSSKFPKAQPSASTWGEQGYSAYWLNDSNAWIYPLLHQAEAELEQLATDLFGLSVSSLQRRALNQAARSVLLAQASDWPFILKSGTSVEYARKRLNDHLARFNYLHESLRKNCLNERYLCALEIMDDIFPNIDFRDYARQNQA